MKKITQSHIAGFTTHLILTEKAKSTKEKYLRDVIAFKNWLGKKELTKEMVLLYKDYLIKNHKPAGVNGALSSLNSFFSFINMHELKAKSIKIQTRIFANKDKELTRAEYERLLNAALSRKNRRLFLIMQTICSCGIRVSELEYITAQAVKTGITSINCKGKLRQVFLPGQLCKMLREYIKTNNIKSGPVFITRNGNPLNRSNIWKMMKSLCDEANVPKDKVFPHNFRHLFARTYYSIQKDIVRLADILGHSSINTTRIYTMESGDTHRRQIQKLGLVRCLK